MGSAWDRIDGNSSLLTFRETAMKILVIGAGGTIGRAVVDALAQHEVVGVGRSSGAVRADLADSASLRAMYEQVGTVDAVVCVAGAAAFGTVAELTDEGVELTLQNLRGRIDLVRYGLPHVRDGGGFVLTSGVLSSRPIPTSTIVTPVGAAVEAFVRTAALALPRSLRINGVSPPLVRGSALKLGLGDQGVPAATVAGWFVEAGKMSALGKCARWKGGASGLPWCFNTLRKKRLAALLSRWRVTKISRTSPSWSTALQR